MATSNPAQKNSPDLSLIAKLEKSAIDCIDSFIDSQLTFYGEDYKVDLVSIQDYVLNDAPPEFTEHIGKNFSEIKSFIKTRNFLWEILECEQSVFVVKKVPQMERSVLDHILKYVENRSRKTEIGAKLEDIFAEMGAHFLDFRRSLGKKMDGVKNFLLKYPQLFVIDPFSKNQTILINRSILVDSAILMPDQCQNQNPLFRVGEGLISWYNPKTYAGQIMDCSGDVTYFRANIIKDADQMLITAGKIYRYEAILHRSTKVRVGVPRRRNDGALSGFNQLEVILRLILWQMLSRFKRPRKRRRRGHVRSRPNLKIPQRKAIHC